MTFVTFEFFEFEMQATPVVRGQRSVTVHWINSYSCFLDIDLGILLSHKNFATKELKKSAGTRLPNDIERTIYP